MIPRLARHRTIVLVSFLALAVSLDACAARTPRDKARVGALAGADAAETISKLETQLYLAGTYDQATHERLVAGKLKILYTTRAYVRAVREIPEGATPTVAVEAARRAAVVAIDDFANVLPAVGKAREAIDLALQTLRAVLAMQMSAGVSLPTDLAGFLALMNLIGMLLASGRTSWERLRAILKQEGATDEELAAADARISAEIIRAEGERPGG